MHFARFVWSPPYKKRTVALQQIRVSLGKLGLNNLVRLERLSSRYRDPADEAQQLRSVYPLQGGEWVDSWQLLRGQPFIWDWVEVDFGSGVYAPLVDGALYGVYLGRSGMFIKPENPIAINALQHSSIR